MWRNALVLLVLATPLAAEDWVALSGAEIETALTGKKLQYDGAWQDFRASGRTLYNAGRDSWGYWAIRDDQYCSQWPPQALWDCYDVAAKGDQIRFMGAHNDVTDGVYVTE
jgi:hypothetical protein